MVAGRPGEFLLLLGCGATSVVATQRVAYQQGGGLMRDFLTAWVLPVAILLPRCTPW